MRKTIRNLAVGGVLFYGAVSAGASSSYLARGSYLNNGSGEGVPYRVPSEEPLEVERMPAIIPKESRVEWADSHWEKDKRKNKKAEILRRRSR